VGYQSLDVGLFNEQALPYASEDGLQRAAALVHTAQQGAEDAQRGVDDAEAQIQKLRDKRTALEAKYADLKSKAHADDEALDNFIAGADISRYREVANKRQQRRAEQDFIGAASGRVMEFLIPRASIDKMRAQVGLAEAQVILSEEHARLFLAKKLLLLRPLVEAEGSSLTTEGGAFEVAIQLVVEARAKQSALAEALRNAEQIFNAGQQSQK
jgi:hypothetical protein